MRDLRTEAVSQTPARPLATPAPVSAYKSSRHTGTDAFLDTASNGGTSTSGTATGGDVARRAYDQDTAGGNGHSGDSSDVNGGSIANEADDDGTIMNTDSGK